MKNKIRSIFTNNNYQEYELGNGFFFVNNSTQKESYWYITEQTMDEVLKTQAEYLMECSTIIKEQSLNKNCNMLLLQKVESALSEEERVLLLKIEEDPYYFRKYVLYYSEEELAELNLLISEDDIWTYISKNIMKTDLFAQFKENYKEYSGLSLFYRILIKLPFLEVDPNNSDGMVDLRQSIVNAMQEKQLTDIYANIVDKTQEISEARLKAMEADDILALILEERV